jgi:hypothetical protein
MVRNVIDLQSGSAQPNFPLTGGGYYNTSAFMSGPNIEHFQANVIDNRAAGSTGVPMGKLWVEQFTAANSGDAFYTLSSVANQALPLFSYGVAQGVPAPTLPYTLSTTVIGQSTGQNQLWICQKGACQAFCTTGATAIAVGTPLVADGAGNLTAGAGLGTAPSALTAVPYGTPGAATVSYQAYARNSAGLDSAVSNTGTSTTSNATLSNANGNTVAGTIPVGTSQVVIVRTAGGPSQGQIQVINVATNATSFSFTDTGIAAGAAYVAPTVPTYAPGVVLAISKGTLIASQSATLVLVQMGGY